MPPIETTEEDLDVGDAAACMELYTRVRCQVEQGIAELQREQAADPERNLGPRLLAQASRLMPAFDLIRGATS